MSMKYEGQHWFYLQRCLPSDRLSEQHHGLDTRVVVLKGAGGRPPPLVVHGVQGGVGVPELLHCCHLDNNQSKVNLSVNQSINSLIDQSINPIINQSINPLINQSINPSINQ